MRRVLVADDSDVARAAIVRRVRAEGLEVVEEATARGASSVDASGLTCALLDIDLGDGFGMEVAEQLRDGGSDLPIAFFSSMSTPEVLERARTFGPVFAKPQDLDVAIDWIRRNTR